MLYLLLPLLYNVNCHNFNKFNIYIYYIDRPFTKSWIRSWEKLNLSQEDGQVSHVLHSCNVKRVVSRVTCEKVLKDFSPEPCVMGLKKQLL